MTEPPASPAVNEGVTIDLSLAHGDALAAGWCVSALQFPRRRESSYLREPSTWNDAAWRSHFVR